MERATGQRYPNGKAKSWLLETFLRPIHFGCSAEEYLADVAYARLAEADGQPICSWARDASGRVIVEGLSLKDKSRRLVVAGDGFKFVPWRVFISYAREDVDAAERLYRSLKRRGANPWMDVKDLKPGQRWQAVIEREIESCSHFLALLSSRSVPKRGFVQAELRRALEVLDRMPEGQIFVIPARLDECPSPHPRFEHLHRVDLFPRWSSGVDHIVRALLSEDDA